MLLVLRHEKLKVDSEDAVVFDFTLILVSKMFHIEIFSKA